MPIPVLKLNLVPSPTLWRQHHQMLGWAGLAAGALALAASLTAWGVQAARTKRAAQESVKLSNLAKDAAGKEASLQQELSSLDIQNEMPRWRLAERIYLERGLPWSRATAELERSLVDGVRTKAISRNRGADGTAELKIRGESQSREAEVRFVENLQKNGLFSQVVMEREGERQGGGQEFELRLPMIATPPPYVALPNVKALQPAPTKASQPIPKAPPKTSVPPSAKPAITPPPSQPTRLKADTSQEEPISSWERARRARESRVKMAEEARALREGANKPPQPSPMPGDAP